MIEELHWYGCYSKQWGDLADPDIVDHPAKFNRGLIYRIYRHMFAMGWLKAGDTVVDPFGGVALGAIPAISPGVHWVGMELEQRFVDIGRRNIARWNDEFGPHIQPWGRAVLLQGDSRKLAQVLADAMVSSPPYGVQGGGRAEGDVMGGGGQESLASLSSGYGDADGQLAEMDHGDFDGVVGSPPYAGSLDSKGHGFDFAKSEPDYPGRKMHQKRVEMRDRLHSERRYGDAEGQLGAMGEGDLDAVISSPPYQGNVGSDDPKKRGGLYKDPKRAGDRSLTAEYGDSPGQMSKLPPGDLDAVVSSPPYAEIRQDGGRMAKGGRRPFGAYTDEPADYWYTQRCQDNMGNMGQGDFDAVVSSPPYADSEMHGGKTKVVQEKDITVSGYGETDGQLSQSSTFWGASRLILEQCFSLLKPGGVAVWVVKDYAKNWERVPFSDQWLQLNLSVGFEHVQTAIAHQEDKTVEQPGLFGGAQRVSKSHLSLFKRDYHAKGGPVIDYETVWFLRKP